MLPGLAQPAAQRDGSLQNGRPAGGEQRTAAEMWRLPHEEQKPMGNQEGGQVSSDERRQLIVVRLAIKALEKGEYGAEVVGPLRRQAMALQEEIARLEPPSKLLREAETRRERAQQAKARAEEDFETAATLAQRNHAKLQQASGDLAQADRELEEAQARMGTPAPNSWPQPPPSQPLGSQAQLQRRSMWHPTQAQSQETGVAAVTEGLSMVVSMASATSQEQELRQATLTSWKHLGRQREQGLQPIVPWQAPSQHGQELDGQGVLWLDTKPFEGTQ